MPEVKVPFVVGDCYAELSLSVASDSPLEEEDLLASVRGEIDDVESDLRRRETLKS